MQYIKTEGLLIDTVEKRASILGDSQETISNNSTGFLNTLNSVTENSSVSFLGTDAETGDNSVSISSDNSTVSSNSFSFNPEDSYVYSDSISINDVDSSIINKGVGILNENEETNHSISILSKSGNNTSSSIEIFSENNKVENKSLSINSSNSILNNNSISINSLNSSLTSSFLYNNSGVNSLSSFSVHGKNSNINYSVSLLGDNNALSGSFLSLSNNTTGINNSFISNCFNNLVSSDSIGIVGFDNFINNKSISLIGNTNVVTNSSINIGSNHNNVDNNSLNFNGYNNDISNDSISFNSIDSEVKNYSTGINSKSSQIADDSVSINSKNSTLELSSVDIFGNDNNINNNSLSVNSKNSNASNESVVLGGSKTSVDKNSIVILSENSNANDKSLVIGGTSNTSDLSSLSIGSVETYIYGSNSQSVGGVKNTFNSSNSVFFGGTNNQGSKTPNSQDYGNNSILIGGVNNKIGSDAIIFGGNDNLAYGRTIIFGGSGNRTNGFDNVVILNRDDVYVDRGDVVYLPQISTNGDMTIHGNISSNGTLTYVDTVIATVTSLDARNFSHDLIPLTVDQYKTSIPDSARFSYNNFPRLGVNRTGVTINSFSVADNQALTVVGNLSTTDVVQVNNRIQFGLDSSVRLYRSKTIPNSLHLFGGLIVGSIGNGSTDLVLTQDGGLVQSRLINELVWDTNAKFLSGSGSGGYLTNHKIIKSNGSNNTLTDSNITDDGSSIVLGLNTSISNSLIISNDLTVGGSSIIGSDSNDTLTINAGPINIPNAKTHADAIIIGSDSRLMRSTTNTLSTNSNFIVGGLITNSSSNSIIVENSGRLEKRPVNPSIFNTTAPYVSAISVNHLNTNKVLKAANGAGITNSIITDDGSTVTVSGNITSYGINTIDASSSNPALKITQSGSGNALVVEDQQNDATPFIVTTSGYVGIGTTTIPERLVVSGNSSISGSVTCNQLVTTGTVKVGTIATNSEGSSFIVHSGNILQQRTLNKAATNTSSTFVSAANLLTANYLAKSSNSNGVSPSIIYDNGSNVGIGTTSPGYSLDISKDTNGIMAARVLNPNSGSSAYSFLLLGNNSNSSGAGIRFNSSTNTGIGGGNALSIINSLAAPIVFATSGTERLRILSDGKVNINSIATGSTDFVLTRDSSNNIQTRTANSIIWDTSASIVKSSSSTVNRLTKYTGSSITGNSSITDTGSLVTVDVNTTFSKPIKVPNGSSTDVSVQFNSVNNTGLYYNTTNGLITNIAGQEKLRVNSNYVYTPTKLGVGTTSFGTESFKVNGSSVFSGSSYFTSEPVVTTANSRIKSTILRQDGSNFYILQGTDSTAGDNWNSDRPFRINNSTGDIYFANGRSHITHDDGIIYSYDGGSTSQRMATRNYVDTKSYGIVKRTVLKPNVTRLRWSFWPGDVYNFKNVLAEPVTYTGFMGNTGSRSSGTVGSTGTNILYGVDTADSTFNYAVASNNSWIHFNISFQFSFFNSHNIGHFRFYISNTEHDAFSISSYEYHENKVSYDYWHDNSASVGTNLRWELRGRSYGGSWRPIIHYARYWDGQSGAATMKYVQPIITITEYTK